MLNLRQKIYQPDKCRGLWIGVLGFVVILTSSGFSQEKLVFEGACSFYGEKLDDETWGWPADAKAQEAINKILKFTGLEKNFDLYAANVPNAAATMINSRRAILYSQDFIERLSGETKNDWVAISIMAHELGHHLQGHTLTGHGTTPDLELQADRYSGFVLFQMKCSLKDAQQAVRSGISDDKKNGSYPAKSARIAAITNGWMAAKELSENKPAKLPAHTDPEPQAETEPTPKSQDSRDIPPASGVQYTARCVFYNDPVGYFVTSSNDIVGAGPQGMAIVGKRIPATYPGFAWMYQTAFITYGVDQNGGIFSRMPNGAPFQVGYVTKP